MIAKRRVLAVGDPDQAIYGFNGATGQCFSDLARLEGAEVLTSNRTRRCPAAVCRVAEQLSDTDSVVTEAVGSTGFAHTVPCNSIAEARSFVASLSDATVLVRTNALADEFNCTKDTALPKKVAPALRQLHRSAKWFQGGNMNRAYQAAESALGKLVVGSVAFDRKSLDELGIPLFGWRTEVARLAKVAHQAAITTNTLADWCAEVSQYAKDRIKNVGWPAKNLGHRLRKAPAAASKRPPFRSASATAKGCAARTVHSAKGETLQSVVLLVDPKVKPADCPSRAWWPAGNGAAASEERRVAFVAVTRAQEGIYLLAPDAVCERLAERRPTFARLLPRFGEQG